MHIPSLLPDECSRGYLGRVRRLNGNPSPKLLRRLLVDELSKSVNDAEEYSSTYILAQLSGIGLQRFVQEHTFIPFLRAVHCQSSGITHGTSSTQGQLMQAGTTLPSKEAQLCKDCIREDLSFWGVAYWRRSHHLPGVVFCQKHGSGLFRADSYAALQGLPTDFEQYAQPIDDRILHEAQRDSVIQRYVEICNAFLESDHPVHPEQAAACLFARANQKALRVSTIGTRPNLSDYAVMKLAGYWLDEFFAHLKDKPTGAFIARIDGPCISKHVPYHASSYALALALLWDSSDEALADFYRPLNSSVPKSNIANRETVTYLRDQINDFSPPPDSTALRQNVDLAIESFVAGSSLAEACEKHSVNPLELEDILRVIASRHASTHVKPMRLN